MNYTELQKANDLLKEIKEIDFNIRMIENPHRDINIGINDYYVPFGSKYKPKFVAIMKEIRTELIEELKKLGVTEDNNND